ncbi:MAG TPA: VWA domain-containing protein [Candidatus Angelobacter sp.]
MMSSNWGLVGVLMHRCPDIPMPRLTSLPLALLIVATATSLYSQTETSPPLSPVFKVKVNLVVVDAQVLKKKTHQPVPALKSDDFMLFEGGIRQQITSLSQDELPLSVVFLFDLTDSVRPVLKSLANGALQSLQHLKPEDEAAVMVYSASTKLLQDFTTDRELIVKAIRRAGKMESAEAAFFNEGIFQAATEAGKPNSQRRRVIIWLTDNVPNIPSEDVRYQYGRSIAAENLHSEKEALTRLFKTGAVVFTLLQRSEISDIEFMRAFNHPIELLYRKQYPPGDVYNYTRQTGGEVVDSYSSRKISARMADLIDQIRTRYALGYHPSMDGQERFREIRLEIAPEVQQREGKVIVETRRGYYR